MFDTNYSPIIDEFTVTDKGAFSLTNPPDEYLDEAIRIATGLKNTMANSAKEAKQYAKAVRKDPQYTVSMSEKPSHEPAVVAAYAVSMKVLRKRHIRNYLEKRQEFQQYAKHYQQVLDNLQTRKAGIK